MYKIEPVFWVFPSICLLFSFDKRRNSRLRFWFITILFILFYSFSLNGADYEGYNSLFEEVLVGSSIREIHGELGYGLLMVFAQKIGMDYQIFRIVLLSVTSVVLFSMLYKMSPNFPLSVFFFTSLFIIYAISAYRQYIVMAFSLVWIYEFVKGNARKAIVGLVGLLFFHITAIIPLAFVLIYKSMRERQTTSIKIFVDKNGIIFIAVVFLLRIFNFYILKISIVNSVLGIIISNRADINPTLFSAGLASRTIFLFFIVILFQYKSSNDKLLMLLFGCYYIGMTLYIAVPLEFFMGRLMNSVNVLSTIIVPYMVYRHHDDRFLGSTVASSNRIVLSILIIVSYVILFNQLSNQIGYTPYTNYLFGRNIAIISEDYG